MPEPIMGDIAIFAAEVQKAFDALLDMHLANEESDLKHIIPIRLVMADTYGDVFAEFYEEGVEFYPDAKIVKKEQA